MKRFLLSLSMAGMVSSLAFGQFDEVKTALALQQYKKANEMLAPLMAKPKNAAKPEGHILQATLLSHLMADSANASKAAELLGQSITSYNKYLEMDPKKELVTDPIYVNAPIAYYSHYFNEGIKGYNKKTWETAAADFKKTVEWSDFIIANKLAKMEFDTTANLLAGAAYQNVKTPEAEAEAVKYFKRLTERKIGGEDNEFVYQFLMGYYFRNDDMANFEKYKALGMELYPKSEYFTYNEIDFIMSMEDEDAKAKKIEAKLTKEPNNIELAESYGFIIFDRLNAEDKPAPANYDELEQKMITNLSKAGDAKPTDGKPFYYLGNHFVNKGVKINQEINAVTDQIKKANAGAKPDKTGKLPPPPKELTDKREALKRAYDAEVDKGLPFLLKSADAYGKATELKGIEKQNYKRLVDQLILIYGDKKVASKVPADKAKYEAEEKKWNAVYTKISH